MSTRRLNTSQRLVEGALGGGGGNSGLGGIASEVTGALGGGNSGLGGIASEVTGALGGSAKGRGGISGVLNVSTIFHPSRVFIIRDPIHDELWQVLT
jgi:hypothetical protein